MAEEADSSTTPALTPSDEHLLGLIRDGRVDAEIAVRMGISNADVKERIERLIRTMRVGDRTELRDPPLVVEKESPSMNVETLARESVSPVRAALWAGTLALVVGLCVGWWIRDGQAGRETTTDHGAAFDSELYSRSLREMVPFEPTPTRPAAFGTQTDLGTIFIVPNVGQAVSMTNVNDSKTVITLAGPATFPIDRDTRWDTVEQSASRWAVSTEIQGQTVTVWLEAGNADTTFERDDTDGLRVTTKDASPPIVKLWVARAPWRFDLNGHLFVVPLLVD